MASNGQNWTFDPATGDYVMDVDGTPLQTNSLNMPAYVRLKVNRKKWMYAPDTEYGSDLYLVKSSKQSSRDLVNVENVAARALQPMANDGRAVQITINATQVGRGFVNLTAAIQEALGTLEQLNLQGIGV